MEGEGRNRRGKVQGRRSIISTLKIDGERSKWYRKQRTQRKLICTTHGHELRQGGDAGGLGGRVEGG